MASGGFSPDRLGGWRCRQYLWGIWGRFGRRKGPGPARNAEPSEVSGRSMQKAPDAMGVGIPPFRAGREEGAVGAVG